MKRLACTGGSAAHPFRSPLPRCRPGLAVVLSLAMAVLSLWAQPAAAQWVWKDENGRVTASDRPPPKNVPDKNILSRPQPVALRAAPPASAPAAEVAAPASAVDPELEARKRSAEQAQEATARAAEQKRAEQRADNCRRARSLQAALDSGLRIARTNDRGEREILDDKGRADELRRAREVIASDCSR